MLGHTIDDRGRAALIEGAGREHVPWLGLDPSVLRRDYNRRPFVFGHRLHEHPLFELDALFGLCRRLSPSQVHCRVGEVPADADFDSSLETYNRGMTLDDAIDHLEERHAYIAVYNPECDPTYRPLIEALLGDVALLTRPLDGGVNWYSTYIFISARNSLTPYHMDREMNFLMQVRGTKTVQLWDPMDDEIMSSDDRDRLLVYDGQRPAYRESFQAKAMTFELGPGLGVHHPFIAPHLVRTGPAVSVTFALTFRTLQSDLWVDAHALNFRLRRWGWHPAPVGDRPGRDWAKARVMRAARSVRGRLRRWADA